MSKPRFDPLLLSRLEDASLNASAPPQQRWIDGWLLRLSPGAAKRARCINAVAAGAQPLADKLRWCGAACRQAGLPLVFRITPFTQPAELDQQLADLGYLRIDPTCVMALEHIEASAPRIDLPATCELQAIDAAGFAEQIGRLRGTPLPQRLAHAQRLQCSPVVHRAMRLVRGGELLACGQIAIEDELVGLYDIFTAEPARCQGWARTLCRLMLAMARRQGARHAYLQVEQDNPAARAVYTQLGFDDAYAYHYRSAPILDSRVRH